MPEDAGAPTISTSTTYEVDIAAEVTGASWFILPKGEPAMDIVKANIERFKLLLKTETDPKKRAMEIRLFAVEQLKLPTLEQK